jgi:TRAP-type C4-dicarboxylate transport system substrate-binding protein
LASALTGFGHELSGNREAFDETPCRTWEPIDAARVRPPGADPPPLRGTDQIVVVAQPDRVLAAVVPLMPGVHIGDRVRFIAINPEGRLPQLMVRATEAGMTPEHAFKESGTPVQHAARPGSVVRRAVLPEDGDGSGDVVLVKVPAERRQEVPDLLPSDQLLDIHVSSAPCTMQRERARTSMRSGRLVLTTCARRFGVRFGKQTSVRLGFKADRTNVWSVGRQGDVLWGILRGSGPAERESVMKLSSRLSVRGIAAALTLTLVAAACGGGTESAPAAPAAPSSPSAPATDEPIAPVRLRLASSLPPGGSIMGIIEWYVGELEARTGGAITTDISYAGSLLSDTEIIPGVRDGAAETGLIVPAYVPGDMPLTQLVYVSTLGHNQAARSRAIQDVYNNNPAVRAEFENLNIKVLGVIGNNTQVAMTTRPVETVEDLRNLRMRVPGNPAVGWRLLGAEPVFLGVGEVYESLQRGVIDGVTFPFDVHMTVGVQEVAKYAFPDIGESGSAMLGMNLDVYNALPQVVKDIMDDLNAEWYDRMEALLTETDRTACDTLLAAGGQVFLWSDAARQEIADLTGAAMLETWKTNAANAGVEPAAVDALWDEYLGYVLAYNETVSYEPGLALCARR